VAAWPDRLEHFLGHYPHVVAGLEAVSTFAAVVVSLSLAALARRANQTKLRARLYIAQLIQQGIDRRNPPEYIVLSITNTGILPLRIPFAFFYWKIPFRRSLMLIRPLDSFQGADPHLPSRPYPIEIRPRTSETIYLRTLHFARDNFKEMRQGKNRAMRFLSGFMKAKVTTEDGRTFNLKLSKDIRHEIKAASTGKSQPPPEPRR
jgi:hypothetical protein